MSLTSLRKLRGSLSEDKFGAEFDEMMQAHDAPENAAALHIRDLFLRPSLRKPLLLAGFLHLSHQLCGINAVLYYSTDIFNKTNPSISAYLTVSIGVLNVILTVMAGAVIDRAGRRPLLLFGTIGLTVVGILYTVAFALNIGGLAVFCTYAYISFFAISLGPIPFLILPELFPTKYLGLASSVVLPINWGFNYLVGQVFPLMSITLGSYAFLPFTGYLVFAAVIIYMFLPETKGKALALILKDMNLPVD